MSNSNSNQDFSKISGTLVYIQMNEPAKAFVKAGAPTKPPEWKASVVLVNEDYVDSLEDYAKSLDTMLSLKKVKSAEFESIYKCKTPEGAGKNVWVLTLRKSTELGRTGKPVPDIYKPKVFEKIKNTMVEITTTKEIANGSFGTISVDRFDRNNGGSSLYLKNLLVTDLIEYIRTESSYEAGSEFGDDTASDGNGGSTRVPASAKTKEAPKVKPKAKPQDDEDDSSDLPF